MMRLRSICTVTLLAAVVVVAGCATSGDPQPPAAPAAKPAPKPAEPAAAADEMADLDVKLVKDIPLSVSYCRADDVMCYAMYSKLIKYGMTKGKLTRIPGEQLENGRRILYGEGTFEAALWLKANQELLRNYTLEKQAAPGIHIALY